MALNKMILVLSLVAAVYLIPSEAVYRYYDAQSMEGAVKMVEIYLKKHVKTDDLKANVDAVSELYEHENDRHNPRDDIKKLTSSIKHLAWTLEGENKCGLPSFSALGYVNRYTNRAAEKENLDTRIEKIARHYAVKHAEECGGDYLSRLEAATRDMDPKIMERVDAYLGVDITFEQPPHGYLMNGVVGDGLMRFKVGPGAAQQAYDALVKVVDDSEDSKNLHGTVSADAVSEVYRKYFSDACEDLYVRIANVALPAIFDNKAVTHGELPDIYNKLIQCMARFSLGRKTRNALVKEIVKIAGNN